MTGADRTEGEPWRLTDDPLTRLVHDLADAVVVADGEELAARMKPDRNEDSS